MPNSRELANALRFLSIDAVQKANSGHPGMPMGAAAMAYALWMRHLRFNPKIQIGQIVIDLFSLGVMARCCSIHCSI